MEPLNQSLASLGTVTPVWIPVVGVALILLTLWSLFWKGLALWHAARRENLGWFIVILLVNTAGILEIIYLFFIAKIKFEQLFKH